MALVSSELPCAVQAAGVASQDRTAPMPMAHTWLSISRQLMLIFAVCCYHDLIFKMRKLRPRKENQCKSMAEWQCRMSCLLIPVYLLKSPGVDVSPLGEPGHEPQLMIGNSPNSDDNSDELLALSAYEYTKTVSCSP